LHNDGGCGWPDYAPFDGIIVAAAPLIIPQMLLQQLTIGGVMVIPVGNDGRQKLHRITRNSNEFAIEALETVSFVPFLSGKE
jgi:protein-L-isoaspartate(D-aspartate) O-methyltransferase